MFDRFLVRAADEGVAAGKRLDGLGLSREGQRRQVAQQLQFRQGPELRFELALRPAAMMSNSVPSSTSTAREIQSSTSVVNFGRHVSWRIASLSLILSSGPVAGPMRSPFHNPTAKPGLQGLDDRPDDPCRSLRCVHPAPSSTASTVQHSGDVRPLKPILANAWALAMEAAPAPLLREMIALALVICGGRPHHEAVFNESKGGDPMSSDFVYQSVASADCPFGKQPS